jgi:PAS domain S-box-containing protein
MATDTTRFSRAAGAAVGVAAAAVLVAVGLGAAAGPAAGLVLVVPAALVGWLRGAAAGVWVGGAAAGVNALLPLLGPDAGAAGAAALGAVLAPVLAGGAAGRLGTAYRTCRAAAAALAAAEARCAEVEARYRCLIEQAADAMFVFGPDDRILDANTQASIALGYTRAELLTLSFADVLASRATGSADGADTKTRECVYRKKDGTTAPVEARIGGVGGKTGGPWVAVVRDMTRRRRAEAALRESERRFRDTLERARLLAVCLDAGGAVTFCNDALLALTGYARAEALGRNWFDTFAPPDERADAARQYRDAVRDGRTPAHHESTVRTRDGRAVVVAWSNTLLRDPDGRPVGTSKLGEDVTDRKRAEAALRDSEHRYRTLLDRTPVPLFVYDRTTLRYLAVNEAAVRAYGYARAEFAHMTIMDIRPPEDHPALRQAVTGGAGGLEARGVWRHRKKDGTVIFADITAHDIDLGGRAACIVLAVDVTDRLRAEAALREREQLLQTVLAHIPCGVFWKDLSGRYLGCNEQAARDLGLASAGAAVGRTGADGPPLPGDRPGGVEEPVLNREEAHPRPGGAATFLTSTVPLRDPAGAVVGVLGMYQDVTARKRLEDQYRQAQKMQAVGQLAGGVAHDFNNLLTAINGYAELLTGDAGLSADARAFAAHIHAAGTRAAHLTRQLLAFSRRQVLEPRVVDLNAVVAETTHLLRRLIGEDVALATALSPTPCGVRADAGQVQQVLLNLAVNARDAMPAGGRLTVAVRTGAPAGDEAGPQPGGAAADPRAFAELAVSDTGCGMTPEVRERIFEPFFTTKGVGKGTGLGLATVFGIVTAHGGHIRVESEPGRGSVFRVYLPRVADPAPPAPESAAAPHRPTGTETLLLAEDEPVVRAFAARTLREHGYEVLEAHDGEEAVRVAAEYGGAIDLLITDVVMPRRGGRQTAEALCRARPRVRVLFMSGYTDDAVVRNGVFHDRVHFLQKPFTPAALADKVREVLDADVPHHDGALGLSR